MLGATEIHEKLRAQSTRTLQALKETIIPQAEAKLVEEQQKEQALLADTTLASSDKEESLAVVQKQVSTIQMQLSCAKKQQSRLESYFKG